MGTFQNINFKTSRLTGWRSLYMNYLYLLPGQDQATYDAFVGGVDGSGAAYGASYNLTDANLFTRHPEDRFSVSLLYFAISLHS